MASAAIEPQVPGRPVKRHKGGEDLPITDSDHEEGPDSYSIFGDLYDAGQYYNFIVGGLDESGDEGEKSCDDSDESCGTPVKHVPKIFDSEEEREKYYSYHEQIRNSQGFDLDFDPKFDIGGIRPVDFKKHTLNVKEVEECVKFAVERNNDDPGKPKLKCLKVKTANLHFASVQTYYITFLAGYAGKKYTFQTKVRFGTEEEGMQLMVLRPLYKKTGERWSYED